jgi:hypothetical protein
VAGMWWWWHHRRGECRTGGQRRRGRGLAEAGPGLPCFFFFFFSFFCVVRIWVTHDKERVTPSRCGTAVDPFSLSCVTFYARQRPMPCVAFPYCARQRSLPGKNASCALCRVPGQNPHGKGCAVRVLTSAVRPWRTAKRANPVVIDSILHVVDHILHTKFFIREI